MGDTDIQGNANVSRNMNVGGAMRVGGDAEFGHGLRVKGYLEAPNIKGANKGLFLSSASLRESYPDPEPGWWALVGSGFPAAVYVASPAGKWVNTGGTSGSVNIDGNGVVIGGESSGGSGSERVSDEEIERIGGVLADDFIPTIRLEDLDSLGTDGSLASMRNFARGLAGKARYAVISDSKQIGTLDLISDTSLHVLTEILTTHESLDADDQISGKGHYDGEIWTYYRSLNLSSPTLADTVDRGDWTAWKILSGRVPENRGGKRFQRFGGVGKKDGALMSLAGSIPMEGASLMYDPDFGFFLRISTGSLGIQHADYANWLEGSEALGIPPKREAGPNAGTLYICPSGIWGMCGNSFTELLHI